jgi:hypothetical protein
MALAGRPSSPHSPPVQQKRYTAQQMRDALLQSRGLVTAAARLLGCDPSTVDNYVREYPTVAAAKKQAREGITDMAEAGLIGAIKDREPWAIRYWLSTQGKDRGYAEKHEVEQKGEVTLRVVYGNRDRDT